MIEHNIKKIINLAIIIIFLQGCMQAATTGAQAIYNRHSIEKNLKDQYLTYKAYQALYVKTDEFKNTNISISTLNKEMLLSGQVPESWQKIKAEKIIKKIPDIQTIYNLLQIQNPPSMLTHVSDTWITTKIKTKLMASNEVDVTKIKVITENGTVYMMGILLPEEADAAVYLASTTAGVKSVVKIFSYVSISKKIKKV